MASPFGAQPGTITIDHWVSMAGHPVVVVERCGRRASETAGDGLFRRPEAIETAAARRNHRRRMLSYLFFFFFYI